ncbi:MAG: oligosaccharide flippase family protein [Massilibacteroides sp.]|nr:oligosaccharide flippase family protein [Massilibacteroides sp.]MDD3062260.1 oligosaccharide flippase family protein [Massilibacteroides sp.]MDD4114001.1 oligosaccharide flippase family protein [Massilibacteroides sp.]MDD4660033.1 oligosaccharide flippase family protein [Massilibacteroides sp.]
MGIVIRQSIKGTIINYVGAIIGFLTTMFILTKYLTEEEIGLTRVILEAATLLAGFAQLGTSASAFRFFPYFKDKEKQNNGFFFYLVTLPLIGCCIYFPLYFLLKKPISNYFITNSALFVDYYNWVVILALFILYWTVFETYSNILMRIAIPKLIREVLVRLILIIVYLLYSFHFLDMDGFIAVFIGTYAIAIILNFIYLSKIEKISLKHDISFIDKPLKKTFFNYTLFLIIGAIGGNLISKIDLFMVSSQMGLNYAGIYSVAFYMAIIVEIPTRSISSISTPLVSQALKEGDTKQANQIYQNVSLHQLLAGSLIFLLIWINIDNVFNIIPNGESYKQGKWVVFFIAVSKLIEITVSFGSYFLHYSRYYYWTLFFTFFITGLTIWMNILFIPIWGITGAAIATVFTTIIVYGIQQWLVLVKVKGNFYTHRIIRVILNLLLLFGLNYLLPSLPNPWVDGIYRTLIIGLTAIITTYNLQISNDVNQLINKIIFKIKELLCK